jgi:tetratricopeptide (TPR) repeat protein
LFKATIGDNASCYNAAVKMHKLIKSHPEALNSYDKLYLRAISARLSALTLMGNLKKEFQTLISELKTNTLRMQDKESRKIAQAIFYEFQLIFLVREKNFEKALELAQTATVFVKENAILNDGNAIKYLSFDIAKTHFVMSNYLEANKWFLKQSYSESKTKSSDIFAFSRILSLFCDIFLNETENIKYNAGYLRNYLSKHGHLFEYESFLLSRITKYFINWNSNSVQEKILMLQNFKLELEKQLDSPWKANMMLYFDFEWWVELLVEQLKSES